MKKALIAVLAAAMMVAGTMSVANADVYVRGYTRSNGTYVAPHFRTNPDGVKWNNYSYGR